jgi:hypothetical protein
MRRRLWLALAGLAGILGLMLIPAPGGATSSSKSAGDSITANSPSQPRCDPQPSNGSGPKPGKGKKCASP